MSKVEQVARAIEDLVAAWAREEADTADIARAAIEAMREPTEAMREAGEASGPRGPLVMPDYDAGKIWQAMIDAALQEDTA